MLLDLLIIEFLAMILGVILLKKVGTHPSAMRGIRNLVIKFGPRAIRSANVIFGDRPES